MRNPLSAEILKVLKNEVKSSPSFRNQDGTHRKGLGEDGWGHYMVVRCFDRQLGEGSQALPRKAQVDLLAEEVT